MGSQKTNPDDFFAGEQSNPNVTPKPDDKASKEQSIFDGDLTDIEVFLKYEKFKIQKENEDSERELRKSNANRAFWFSAIWAVFVAFIVLLHASCRYFVLKESEFIFVIGSLTASILTYYLLVIKYLFYRGNDNNTDTKQ